MHLRDLLHGVRLAFAGLTECGQSLRQVIAMNVEKAIEFGCILETAVEALAGKGNRRVRRIAQQNDLFAMMGVPHLIVTKSWASNFMNSSAIVGKRLASLVT